jgi:hypothetical protein
MCNVGLHYVFIRTSCSTTILPCGAPGYRLGDKMKKKPSRQRVQPLKVWALPAEAVAIKGNAGNCGMSVSSYLRNLGLNHKPKSILDADAVIALAKVNGDLGRLGGLLKMLLTNDERLKSLGKDTPKIDDLLEQIQASQVLLFEKVKQV